MLSELAIKNFAIIDDIRISFSRGFSVLTGETGAGKSIIIEAVNLLLGGRAASDLVRTGEKIAELEATFDIEPGSPAALIMADQDMDPNEGLMIRRVIAASGKHKVYINSRQSTMQLLKQVTCNLAGISSQHAHQSLFNEENHLSILDRFAKTQTLAAEVRHLYNALNPLVRQIHELRAGADQTDQENDFLKFQIDEIKAANIRADEDETLQKERLRLKNGTEILTCVTSAVDELFSRENAILERLGRIRNDLEKRSALDPALVQIAGKASQALFDLEDLAEELRIYTSRIDLDPEHLDRTEERLDLIQRLKRKYGGTLEQLFKRYADMQSRLEQTGNVEQRIARLEKEAEEIAATLREKAMTLSEKRKAGAETLGHLAEKELGELEMGNTRFVVFLGHIPADETGYFTVDKRLISPTGMDRVSFLISPNPGEEPRPLSRIASGGELSRVVLALKAILSRTEALGTLVFDEVDSGVGGKTSDKVGKKLRALAETYQVICITHLAQIARFGTSHFRIEKKVHNGRTATAITPLADMESRVAEIARMIGGEKITSTTLAHAREMLTNHFPY
ncbi:RecN [Desulforapulum autotrophicum HRM2]|uniref:DNA repair protein RecN n=1 Tax=Desulforapulum autotrophicum (strain ATCC 43914 / DSM 3382 / VKM B-1955 / HRM2) TaxID=177437 RepID=C0QFJ9_DESAH|nr:DNA repair protein RecN [Desulforapulum autotrophicum]ACN13395.1 RecN [Desulforapulum autotrophicum HRM2]